MRGAADDATPVGPVSRPPVPPGPSRWALHPPTPDQDDLVAVGADLEPSTVVHAYSIGLFPMGVGEAGGPPLGRWSPEERGVLLPGDLHVSRSVRRSRRRFSVTVDSAFAGVVAACADPSREGRWITPEVANAYGRLHELGWAHSVEVWAGEQLAGGLYGVAVGGLFAGESMFHRRTDASKVALWALADLWFADGDPRRIIDVQWQTAHLASLGVRAIERADYLLRLASAVKVPWLDWVPDTARRGFDPT
jgi:leucyl/phenylalanyl-tRNA--protein transferase